MPTANVTLQALGLNLNPNQLSVPSGSMVRAKNVVIDRDNVVNPMRGFKEYSTTIIAKQLLEYKGRLLCHNASNISFDTTVLNTFGESVFQNFDGIYQEVEAGLRIKSVEANKNLYFTTSTGIKKISATSADEFNSDAGYIVDAGALRCLDIKADLNVEQGQTSGFLPNDSSVAYRAVLGYKDINNNLILGSPSDRVVVYNYLSQVIAMDYNSLLTRIDAIGRVSGCLINDLNYANTLSIASNSEATTEKNAIISLCNKLDNDLVLGTEVTTAGVPLDISSAVRDAGGVVTITCSSGNPTLYFQIGDIIEVRNTTGTFSAINGTFTITGVTATTFTFLSVAGAALGAGTPTAMQVVSYNYRNIYLTGDEFFPTSLNDMEIPLVPTTENYRIIQNCINRIISRLRIELTDVIPTSAKTSYLNNFNITENAGVDLRITLPPNLPSYYFVQIYRTRLFTAESVQSLGGTSGIPINPDDEMRLVFERFPTTAELTADELEFYDEYPEDLVQNNTNLYTNPVTGEGILQANDAPPLAKDIARFKNNTFYFNTKTKHKIVPFQLLGVANINNGDKITIGSLNSPGVTYTFVSGVNEISEIICTTVVLGDAGKYILLYSGTDDRAICFWLSVNGTGSQPVVAADRYVQVPLFTTLTNVQVAEALKNAINTQIYDFSAVNVSNTITVTTLVPFATTNIAKDPSLGFTVSTTTQGIGENATNKQVLLSNSLSAAQAIDETARSLIRVINKQAIGVVYAYYISSETTPPGQIFLEAKTLEDSTFYVVSNNVLVGESFNPNISPVLTNITGITTGISTSTITTATAHGFINEDIVILTNTNSTPAVDGVYIISNATTNTFDIQLLSAVTVAGTQGSATTDFDTLAKSTNDENPNRFFSSKNQQPEAVPIGNWGVAGASDKQILRGVPLRDSLFLFKEDGLYRVSGQSFPFQVDLFDESCKLLAPDSVAVLENVIYAWTTKGIVNVTESGVEEISQPVEIAIKRLASAVFPNFKTVTWAVGYNSDDSYTVYTNLEPTDQVATIAFRYSSRTKTWTTIEDRSERCGIVLSSDDKLYMGGADRNFIHQERKSFTRTDHANRDFAATLQNNSVVNPTTIQFTDTSEMTVGDVLVQEQDLNIYLFNKLLTQLDLDPAVALSNNYFSTLEAVAGDNLRTKLELLAAKLDTDLGGSAYTNLVSSKSGTITGNAAGAVTIITTSAPHGLINGRLVTISGTQTPASSPSIVGTFEVTVTGASTFTIPVNVLVSGGTGLSFNTGPNLLTNQDLKICFNAIVSALNVDVNVIFSNYKPVTETTLIETVITHINNFTNRIDVDLPGLPWIVGAMRVYKAIDTEVQYCPITFGDPLMHKQVYECTSMFDALAFTSASMGFSSDLKPEFEDIEFNESGNGIFGHYSQPGFGYGFFGGGSNSAPFRTIIPRMHQRCRYMNVRFKHMVAREPWALNGVTLTANTGISTRAYR